MSSGNQAMIMSDTGTPKDGAAALLELWSEFVTLARENVLNPNPALLPPFTQLEYPAVPMGTTALPPTLSLTVDSMGDAINHETANRRLSQQPPAGGTTLGGGTSTSGSPVASPSTKGKGQGHGYRGPKKGLQNLIEVEMQRMVLAHKIGQTIDEILDGPFDGTKYGDGAGMISRSMKASASGKSLAGMVTARSSGSKDRSLSDNALLQSLVARHIDTKTLVSAVYVCDFGNVISGTGTTCPPPTTHTHQSPPNQLTNLF